MPITTRSSQVTHKFCLTQLHVGGSYDPLLDLLEEFTEPKETLSWFATLLCNKEYDEGHTGEQPDEEAHMTPEGSQGQGLQSL